MGCAARIRGMAWRAASAIRKSWMVIRTRAFARQFRVSEPGALLLFLGDVVKELRQ
jgi:hypothetical protein